MAFSHDDNLQLTQGRMGWKLNIQVANRRSFLLRGHVPGDEETQLPSQYRGCKLCSCSVTSTNNWAWLPWIATCQACRLKLKDTSMFCPMHLQRCRPHYERLNLSLLTCTKIRGNSICRFPERSWLQGHIMMALDLNRKDWYHLLWTNNLIPAYFATEASLRGRGECGIAKNSHNISPTIRAEFSHTKIRRRHLKNPSLNWFLEYI